MSNLGPCCACGVDDATCRNIMMQDFEAPEGFAGWACLQCDLPPRGAISILCDGCLDKMSDGHQVTVGYICGGKYPTEKVRVSLADYPRKPVAHDLRKHPEMEAANDDNA